MLCENVGRNVSNRMSSGLRGEGKKQDVPKTAMLEAAKLLVIDYSELGESMLCTRDLLSSN